MRITLKENLLYVKIADEQGRGKFFYDLNGVPFHSWVDAETVTYDLTAFSERTTALHVKKIASAARRSGIEVSEEAETLFSKYISIYERYQEEERRARMEEADAQRKINAGLSKQKYGCSLCEDLKWDHGMPFCQHCAERCTVDSWEVERLFEEYKETRRMQRPTAFPAKGCKYVTEARAVALKNKTMEEFIYGVQRSVQN